MIKFIKNIFPPSVWRVPVIVLCGIFAGLFLFLVVVSNAHSYLSDNPKTCVNCHIMAPQYATWSHSSHRMTTNCNDCHVPHNTIFNKYFFKAKDGMRHATIFTLRAEPQVIQIKKEGKEAVFNNCLRCHSGLLTDSKLLSRTQSFQNYRESRSCRDCHREVPHGRVNSLASTPFAKVPLPESPVPDWMKLKLKPQVENKK